MTRFQGTFTALVVGQAAHSVEEYAGRLWESFPPARAVSGMVSADPEVGFVLVNASLLLFGLWCVVYPVRCGWPSATVVAWLWVALELVNGLGHPLWSLSRGAYTPGLGTSIVLLVLAGWMGGQLLTRPAPTGTRSSE